MQTGLAILAILGAIAIGAISPGPSFVLVARTAVAQSRRAGLAAAAGMGTGSVILATLALIGLQALLAEAGWLAAGLKLAGGLYLLYLAVRLWRGAATPMAMGAVLDGGGTRAFWLALGTQLSNPKALLFYATIVAALLPAAPPAWLGPVLLPLIFAVEAGWYTVVAVAFSSARPRAAYLRAKAAIDRVAATVMAALGLRLMVGAVVR